MQDVEEKFLSPFSKPRVSECRGKFTFTMPSGSGLREAKGNRTSVVLEGLNRVAEHKNKKSTRSQVLNNS